MNWENSHAQRVMQRAPARMSAMDAFTAKSKSDRCSAIRPAALVAFDVVAVGGVHDVVEIGAVRYENGEKVSEYSTFVNLGREVPPEALEWSGIHPFTISAAPGLAEVIPAFDAFITNAVLMAHRDSYNIWVMRKAYEKMNGALLNPTADSLPCARRLFSTLRRRYPYPDDLMNDFMTPHAEHYRMVESAKFCGEEYLRAFEEIYTKSLPLHTL